MKAPAVPPIAELELGPFIVMTGSSKPSILENDCKAKVPAPAENLIFFVFRPDKPLSGCNACRNLVHVQFVRTLADSGSGPVPIKESEFQGVAGMQFDAVTEDKELWHVDQDHVAPSLQPFLQGVDQSSENGCAGFKSFIASHSSWSFDQPSTAGGSKGFFDPSTKTGPWRTIMFQFATFAWCFRGSDCGTFYQGVSWRYTKTFEDHLKKRPGKTSVTFSDLMTQPTARQLEAFKKWNEQVGFDPCSTLVDRV